MRETSQLLKNQREAMDISLVEVSIATKITPRTLQAMEAADLDHLPARSFLRGFVKSYAAFLKMDVDDVLRTFQEEMTALENPPIVLGATPISDVVTPNPEINVPRAPEPKTAGPLMEEDSTARTKKIGAILGLIALVAVVSMVYRLVMKYEREGQVEALPPTLSKDEPTADELVAKTPAESEIEPAKPVEAKADEKKPETEPPKPTEAKPLENKAVEAKPVETKAVETKPVEVKPPPETKPAAVAAVTPPPPPKTEEPSRKPVQEIIIEALDKVDLNFKIGNGDNQKVTLLPDQVHTIKAAGLIGLELSDGGAVNIIVNGRDVGVPGDLGKPKKIQFP